MRPCMRLARERRNKLLKDRAWWCVIVLVILLLATAQPACCAWKLSIPKGAHVGSVVPVEISYEDFTDLVHSLGCFVTDMNVVVLRHPILAKLLDLSGRNYILFLKAVNASGVCYCVTVLVYEGQQKDVSVQKLYQGNGA